MHEIAWLKCWPVTGPAAHMSLLLLLLQPSPQPLRKERGSSGDQQLPYAQITCYNIVHVHFVLGQLAELARPHPGANAGKH